MEHKGWLTVRLSMRRATEIKLDENTRRKLDAISRSRSASVRLVERARIVLLSAQGRENIEIAKVLRISRQKASRWRERFAEFGIEGIEKDAPRPGRFPSISRGKKANVIKKTLEEKPEKATHWSRKLMSEATGISESTIGRIWREHGLKPHLSKTFKLSNDKRFVEKLEDV